MRKIVIGVCALVLVSCAAAKLAAKTAIEASLAACLAEHSDAEQSELKEFCKWDEATAPLVEQLLAAHKKGAAKHDAKMAAAHPGCMPATASDAGAPKPDAGAAGK